MVQDIYRKESQVLSALFADGGRFLVVPLDFAKSEHTAQCCTNDGRYQWQKPLQVWNNTRGVEFLLDHVQKTCRKLSVKPERALFTGEDPSSFALPFVEELMRRNVKFVRVRAIKAAELRKNSRASSDTLDLDGIAHAVLHRFATDMEDSAGLYARLRLAARSRGRTVKLETATKSRIHQLVDRLFPGFLTDGKSGIHPFGPACLAILADGISPQKVLAMRQDRLPAWLKKHGVWKPTEAAETLRSLATTAPQPSLNLLTNLNANLRTKVNLLLAVREELKTEENEMARCLVQMPGALFTSIPGLGITLAGGIVAECGDPTRQRSVDQTFSYAGCAQRQKQSGGPDKPPAQQGMPKNCNHRLKDCLLQAAFHVGTTAHPARPVPSINGDHRLRQHWQQLEDGGRHSRLGTARLLLRILAAMEHENRIYLPEWWLHPERTGEKPDPTTAALWLEATTVAMENKWRDYDLTGIPDEQNVLKQWRTHADELLKQLSPIPF